MTTDISSILPDINYEIYSLVWLDNQPNPFPNLQEKFRTIVNYLKIFDNIHQCEEYLQSSSIYDRIILLINSQFAEELIPKIYPLRQIISIYIYGINQPAIRQYSKIYKYIELESDELLKHIQSDQKQINDPIAFSLYKSNNQFIYFQLLLDALFRLEIPIPTRVQLIALCQEIYKNNPGQLDILDEFEETYLSNHVLEWYKRDTCFTKILTKGFCIENFNILFLFRFFIYDMQYKLQQNQYLTSIRVYRSCYLSNDELDLFKNSIADWILIKSFFLMKIDRQQSIEEFDLGGASDNLHKVLFEIDLDPQLDQIKPFSLINSDSEVIIMAGAIFRIIEINSTDEQFWIIRMKLSSINDENLKSTFDSIKTEIEYNNLPINLVTFGNLLKKMNKLDDAEKYYLQIIHLLPYDHVDRANLYYHLGHIYSDKNSYDLSLKYYNKSLEIWIKFFDLNASDIANNYNVIATTYWKKGDYQQAYEYFHKALEIFQKISPEDHITIGMCLNNLGTVISNEKNYQKSLNYYLKALKIFQKNFPSNHPNLASLHSNIGTMYKNLNQIDLALEHLITSLKIYEKFLPINHQTIIILLKNLAVLYEQNNEYQSALIYYEKLLNIYRQTLTSNDLLIKDIEEKIQCLLSKISRK